MLIRYLSAGNSMRLSVLAATLMHAQFNLTWAQSQDTAPISASKSSVDVAKERDATRQMIENVNSDKAGLLDNAQTLGTTLKSRGPKADQTIKLPADKEPAISQASVEARQTKLITEPIVLNQWPQLVNPDKAVGRVERKRRGQANQDESLVYTPDFSRQRLTFGVMVKTPYIDLPDQEVNESNSTLNFDKSAVDIAGAKNLVELIKMGLNNSQVMDQAQAQIDIAISRSKQARSELFPKASARLQKGPEKSEPLNQASNKHTTKSSSVRLSQPIINLPAINDWMAELSNEQATIWRSYVASESVSLAVTNAFINVSVARMVMEFSDEQLVEFNDLLNYIQNRNQSGVASVADLERIRARVLQARQSRIEQQANYRSALLELERLVGVKPSTIQLPYLNQFPGLPATQSLIRQFVWENSQDLRILRKDIQVQEKVISSIYSRLYPTVSLNVEKDQSENVRGANASQTDTRAVGVMSWEFSLGGKDVYAAKLAKAELANRQSKLAEEEDRIMQGVDADFALLQSATLRISTGLAEQDAAMIVLNTLRQQMKTGRVGSMMEAMDANERYFNARQRLVQTLSQQMQAHAQLLRRLGTLSQLQNMVNQTSNINSSMAIVKSPEKNDTLELKKPVTVKEKNQGVKNMPDAGETPLPKVDSVPSGQSAIPPVSDTNVQTQAIDKQKAVSKILPAVVIINKESPDATAPSSMEVEPSNYITDINEKNPTDSRSIDPAKEFSIEPLEEKK